jgi:hypothetical protein
MNESETQVKHPKIDPIAVLRDKLTPMTSSATEADKTLAKEIVDLAKSANTVTIRQFSVSPATCALLFLERNKHNRDLSVPHVEELARRMTAGIWKNINATIGFYSDGEIGDGQHRLGAAALAGFTLIDYPFVFGMKHDAIDTVDSPKVRDGASHAKL